MSERLEGGCLCGRVRFSISGPPRVVTHCHCTDCRKAFGAAFVTWVTADRGDFRWTGDAPALYASSAAVRRGFCPTCGTSLSFEHSDHADEIDVAASALDAPDAVTPEDHIWWQSRVSWVERGDGLPRLARSHYEHGYPERHG